MKPKEILAKPRDFIITNKINLSVFFIFLAFLLYSIYQNMHVFLYFDDYGYAALNYGGHIESAKGQSYTFLQGIEFLRQHYMNWGGRILYFAIQIFLFRFGLDSIRIFQAFVYVAIAFSIYKYVSTKLPNSKILIALATCLMYGLFTVNVASEALYWFSASVLYVFPILPSMILIYYVFKMFNTYLKGENVSVWQYMITILMGFLVGFSHEQIAFALLVFCFLIIIYSKLKLKSIKLIFVFNFISTLIGFIILYIAPGNLARQSSDSFYKLSIIDKLYTSINNIFEYAFVKANWFLFAILLFFTSYLLYQLSKVFKKAKWIHIDFSILSAIVSLYMIRTNGKFLDGVFKTEWYYKPSIIITLMIIVYAFVAYIVVIKKDMEQLIILFTAACIVIPTLYSPYWVTRMIVPFMFIMFPIFVEIICDIFCVNDQKNYIVHVWKFCCVLFAIISVTTLFTMAKGYRSNSSVKIYNDELLKEVAARGQTSGVVDLKMNVNDAYSGLEPYMVGSHEDLDDKMKKYYGIPYEVKFNWVKQE